MVQGFFLSALVREILTQTFRIFFQILSIFVKKILGEFLLQKYPNFIAKPLVIFLKQPYKMVKICGKSFFEQMPP